MTNLSPLQPGRYYHIYNRTNGKENLFREEANYVNFLELYDKYILPVANVFTWVRISNHFHLLDWIKGEIHYKYTKEDFKRMML